MRSIDNLKIFIIRKNIAVNSAESFISKGLKSGFKDLGLDCFIVSSTDEIDNKFEKILVIDDISNCTSYEEIEKRKKLSSKGIIIALWIHWPIKNQNKKNESLWNDLLLKNNNIFQIFYGEREEKGMHQFSQIVKRDYYVIPNASPKGLDATQEDLKMKNTYDIVFIGAKYKTKDFLFEKVIPNLKKSRNGKISIGFFGKGFNKRVRISNFLIKLVNKTIRVIEPTFANYINKKVSKIGTVIPETREPLIYKNSKICINYHEDNPGHIIYNMRYFKIPYFGGFQIVDAPLEKSPYFDNDEVVHISSNKITDWVDTINYYLDNPEARNQIKEKGFLKAKKMHSYKNRAQKFIDLYLNIKE